MQFHFPGHSMAALALTAAFFAALDAPMSARQGTPPRATPPQTTPAQESQRFPYDEMTDEERAVLERMLEAPDWAIRAIGLLRLMRFEGPRVTECLTLALSDPSWQVRCFAIAQATSRGIPIEPARFDVEQDGRVIRAAATRGVALPATLIDGWVDRLFRIRTVDSILLGIELAAASPTPAVRSEATRRVLAIVRDTDARLFPLISRRLAATLQLSPAPASIAEWRAWLQGRDEQYQLPAPMPLPLRLNASPVISGAEAEDFVRLRDYLGALRQRNLQMAIAIDATNSMGPMIDAVRADVDALILFLSDLSATMELGILAYRDHDNPGGLIEGHPFSTNLESLRNFLFGLKTPGGATYPEAVLDGLLACRQFEWKRESEREIIVIGDAPPHDKDGSEVRRLLEWYRHEGFTIHTVHVPMLFPAGSVETMPPAARQQQETWRQEYNIATRAVFQDMATLGGGELVELDSLAQNDLVRAIMKLTIEPEWWPHFDEFYDAYLLLCR